MTTVRKIFATNPGDPSVGIQAISATLEGDGDYLFDLGVIAEEDQKEYLEDIRVKYSELMTLIWGESARVHFDFELED